MRFYVIAALVGASQSVKIQENMRAMRTKGNLKDICRNYMTI